MPDNNVVILVDVQNIYYTCRQGFGRNFDYNQFWNMATHNNDGSPRTVVKAIAYAVDRGDEKQKQFQNILRAIGFQVKLKPYIQRADGTSKGDWDVGITLDAVEYAPEADTLVLASGDGDFGILVQRLQHKFQSRVEVYGVEQLTADSLISAADHYVPIQGKLLLK